MDAHSTDFMNASLAECRTYHEQRAREFHDLSRNSKSQQSIRYCDAQAGRHYVWANMLRLREAE